MRWIFLLLLLIPTLAFGQSYNATSYTAGSFNTPGCSGTGGVCFADLGSFNVQNNGTITYCKDCTRTPLCSAGGTGAIAMRIAGGWTCADTVGPFNSTTTNLYAGPGDIQITGNTSGSSITNMNVNGVLNVKAYGAKGDGVHDDAPAINAAESAARANNRCVYLPAGNYLVNEDLNFSSSTAQRFCLYGDSAMNTTILCEDTGGNCIDASGADNYYIHDLFLQGGTSSANAPKVGLLSARTTGAAVGFGYQLTNLFIFSNGPHGWYNYGGELAHTNGSRFNAATNSVVFSATNSYNVTSRWQTLVSPIPTMTGAPGMIGYGTSMSSIYMVNTQFGVAGGSCGIMFDNLAVPGPSGGWSYFTPIHDVFIYGSYFGEASGGGTALCSNSTPYGNGGNVINMTVDGARMEASDNNANYAFANFTGSVVTSITLRGIIFGINVVPTLPLLSFSLVDSSYLDVQPSQVPAGLTLVTLGGHQNRIFNIPINKMSSIWGPGSSNMFTTETTGNSFAWYDAVNGVGVVDNAGYESGQPNVTINGTTGTIQWAMPRHALHGKEMVLNFQNWTGTAQTITVPYTFLNVPTSTGSCPAGLIVNSGASIGVPAIAGAFTGQCLIVGM